MVVQGFMYVKEFYKHLIKNTFHLFLVNFCNLYHLSIVYTTSFHPLLCSETFQVCRIFSSPSADKFLPMFPDFASVFAALVIVSHNDRLLEYLNLDGAALVRSPLMQPSTAAQNKQTAGPSPCEKLVLMRNNTSSRHYSIAWSSFYSRPTRTRQCVCCSLGNYPHPTAQKLLFSGQS